MIILGEDEAQLPKLSTPSPVYTPPVNRCTTPASSLPDYETSEAQHLTQDDGKWKQRPRNYRRWRLILICLLVYSFLTLIIGVPLLVIVRQPLYKVFAVLFTNPYQKLRNEKHPTSMSQWNPQQASVVLPGSEITSSPPSFEDAKDCDIWSDSGTPYDGWFTSKYVLPSVLSLICCALPLPFKGSIIPYPSPRVSSSAQTAHTRPMVLPLPQSLAPYSSI